MTGIHKEESLNVYPWSAKPYGAGFVLVSFQGASWQCADSEGTGFAECRQRRWTEACHNATQLFHEIRSQGYRGMVAQFVSGWWMPKHDGLAVTAHAQKVAAAISSGARTAGTDQLTEKNGRLVRSNVVRLAPN